MQQTTVQSPVIILYIIQGMLLILVLLFGAVASRAVRRPMPYRVWFFPMESILTATMLAAVFVGTSVRAAPAFLAMVAGAGALVGMMAGAAAAPFAAAGRLVLKRTGLSQFALVSSYGLLAAAAWYAPKPYISAALGVVTLATGAVIGDDLTRMVRGAYWSRIVRRIPMADPYEPEEEAEPVPATYATPGSCPLDVRPAWAQQLADDISPDAPWRKRRPFLVLWLRRPKKAKNRK